MGDTVYLYGYKADVSSVSCDSMSFISTVYVPSDNAFTKLYCTAIVNGIKLKCPYMLLIEKLKTFCNYEGISKNEYPGSIRKYTNRHTQTTNAHR